MAWGVAAVIRPEQVWLAVEAVDMRLGIDGLSLRASPGPRVTRRCGP